MNKSRARRGMSMIEVLLALAILASAVLAVMGMFPAMAVLNGNTIDNTKHLYAAQYMMDQLVTANAFISTSTYGTDNPLGDGSRTWIGIADPAGDAKVQLIQVTCTWTHEGRIGRITLYGMVNP